MKNWLSESQFQLLLKPIQTFLKVCRNVSYFSIYFLLKILGIKKNSNFVHDSFFFKKVAINMHTFKYTDADVCTCLYILHFKFNI